MSTVTVRNPKLPQDPDAPNPRLMKPAEYKDAPPRQPVTSKASTHTRQSDEQTVRPSKPT